jgi:allophanate hydrolase
MIELSIGSLRRGYENGEYSPLDVINEIQERIAQTRSFNIWISLVDADAMTSYVDALLATPVKDLPLWGVPFAIKDNIDLAGCETTAGCPGFAYLPEASATVVDRLVAAGAIPMGKTNLDQFATGLVGTRSPFGAVGNSVDPSYISGGSSSGSSVAVALGLVTFALGTDTAGSGRIPAGFNGIVGFKPTKGWLSTKGVVPACKSLDCVSVFTQSAQDAKLVSEVCGGVDDDPWSRQVSFAGFDASAPRIGVLGDIDLEVCTAEFKEAYLGFIGNLSTTTIDLQPFSDTAALLYDGPWVAERYAALEDFIRDHTEDIHPVTREIISQGSAATAVDAFNGEYKLQHLRLQVEGIFKDIDVMVVPTAPRIFTIDEVNESPIATNAQLGAYCNFVNLLDLCAISIPAAPLANGLPFGVTIIARSGRDHAIMDVAARLLGESVDRDSRPGEFHVAVCGAHLRGQPLNIDLVNRGGYLVEGTRTAANYRLYALPDGKRPALIRDPQCDSSIEVEVWSLPDREVAGFLGTIAQPLGIGSVELAGGRWVHSFIAEPIAIEHATEITEFGGWRNYKSSL